MLGFQRKGRAALRRFTPEGVHAACGPQRGRELPFGETAIGLDHLAFAVPTRSELSDQERRFAPTAAADPIPGAAVVVLRDPGNIQLELFFEP